LKEVRAIYGYKKPAPQLCANRCHCSDCWKVQDRGRTDLEWFELVKMGIRPCFPYPGKNYVREMYVAMSDDVMAAEFMWHKISENHQKHFHEFLAYYKRDADNYCRSVEKGEEITNKKTNRQRVYGNFVRMGGEQREEITMQSLPLQTPSKEVAMQIAKMFPGVEVERRGFLYKVKFKVTHQSKQEKIGHTPWKKKPGMREGIEENPGDKGFFLNCFQEQPDFERVGQDLYESIGEERQRNLIAWAQRMLDQQQVPELMPLEMNVHVEAFGDDFVINQLSLWDDERVERDQVSFDWFGVDEHVTEEQLESDQELLAEYMSSHMVESGETLTHGYRCFCQECNNLRMRSHGIECVCLHCQESERRQALRGPPQIEGHDDDCECGDCEQLVMDTIHLDQILVDAGYHITTCVCDLCFADPD